jgi:thioredoxin reductase (NADPH)
LAQVNDLHDHRLPVCLLPDGVRLNNPTIRQIAEKLGWFQKPSSAEYDLAILGGGPAGLSAAVYGASEGLKTLLIERYAVGGQAGTSSRIENYLGFPQGISGTDLAKRARDQANRFGAEMLLLHEGVRAELVPGKSIGHLADGTSFVMRAAICASGVEYRRLNLWNEERLRGPGVFYGAGTSEAELCSSQEVFVVGGGNSAGQAAIHFSRYARRIYILIRGDGLKETLSQYLINRISASTNIEVRPHTEVVELHGDNHLEAITLIDNLTGRQETINACWLFPMPRRSSQHELGWRSRLGARRTMLSRYRSGFTTAQWLCRDMAAQSRTYYLENQLSRNVRRRRCSPWLREAMRLGCRGRRNGCYLCAPLFSQPLKGRKLCQPVPIWTRFDPYPLALPKAVKSA